MYDQLQEKFEMNDIVDQSGNPCSHRLGTTCADDPSITS